MDIDYALSFDLLGHDGRRYQLRFRGEVSGAGQLVGVIAKDRSERAIVLELSRPGVYLHDVAPVLYGLEKWVCLTSHTIDLSAFRRCIDDAGLGRRPEGVLDGMPCDADSGVLSAAMRVSSPNDAADVRPVELMRSRFSWKNKSRQCDPAIDRRWIVRRYRRMQEAMGRK